MWIRPSLLSLEFIRQEVTSLGLEAVASVGCGCGTLEWLLQMATGRCSIELQTKDHTKVYNHGEGPYPTRAFSWLRAATTAFTLKTLC